MTMEPSTMAVRANQPKNLAEEPLDSTHILACPRVDYMSVKDRVEDAGKGKWMAKLQVVSPLSCCRDPANYDIEAWYSSPADRDLGVPDLYKFYCRVCEKRVADGVPDERGVIHDGCCKAAWCIGGLDYRPMWEAR